MVDESTITVCDVGGCVGAVMIDEQPHATPGRIRPFVWAYLLLRGAVRQCEVAGALCGQVSGDDIRITAEDCDDVRTPLELTIESVMAEMVAEGLLRLAHKDSDLFVLATVGTRQALSLACSLNAQMPDHLLNDVGR